MPAPASASRHYRRLQRLQVVTIAGLRRTWRRMDPARSWERQYQDEVGPQILALVVAAQLAATQEADSYVADVLNELAFGPPTTPGVVRPRSLAGFTGDGRPVETLLASSVGRARAIQSNLRELQIADSLTVTTPSTRQQAEQALSDTERFLETVTQSILADCARAAEEVAMAQRPWVDGWVRMINPPCCSRCAILSGRFYLFTEGFLRHPNCDCYHVPAPANGPALDQLLDVNSPDRYFTSLSDAEQNKIFTNAGAEAIRNGADMSQVVNARRGMRQAQVHGQDVLTTTEGTTRRGRAGRGYGHRRGKVVRLMPEAIVQIAGDDRAELIRLLTFHGYIT